MSENEKLGASFWFDPVCPWAWMTSRWILEVEKVRDIEVRWHIMSLQVLNEPKADELPEPYADAVKSGRWWGPVRIVAAAEREFGNEVVGALYTALGIRIHNRGLDVDEQTLADAVAEAGLPRRLVEAATSTEFDDEVRASHNRGIDLVGQEVGTPVIAVPGADGQPNAFFGPVVTPAPTGEAAGNLWDGTLLVAATPGFFELKRSRTQDPIFE